MLILHWKPPQPLRPFHAHLALDNSASRLTDQTGTDSGIMRRGLDVAVAQQRLNNANVGALLEQVRGEAMAQGVYGNAFGQPGPAGGFATGQLQSSAVHVPSLAPGGKHPERRACGAPPDAEYVQQSFGKHGVAVFVPLALLDAQQHALGVDIGDLQ
ncbi:MAG: hypothetical protein WB696_27915, partial [Chthoniobacterales bacterium]